MKSEQAGIDTSESQNKAQVLNVSPHGLWILVQGKEYFLDFDLFPWFKKAEIEQIFRVSLLHETHLFWEDLDVDLHIDSIENPRDYPLSAS